jgi:diguanylate cyclase (GGDEF)-like protein/putative nucleotidyltransferase with HDIG domain
VPYAFSEQDVATLGAIADQAGIALQKVRLFEEEMELRRRAETRARRLEHIQRVGERLKMDLDEQQIGVRMVEAAREAIGFRMAVLNLFDRPGDPASRARVVSMAGIPPEGAAALLDHDFSLAAVEDLLRPEFLLSRSYFIPEESSALIDGNEVTSWRATLDNTGADAWRSGDELLVPLTDLQGKHLYGFLSVSDPESGCRPEREEVEVLEIFADQAVVALRNAHLLAQARRQAERDPVTGLLNHRAANARLEAAVSVALSRDEPLSLLMIDVDNFKLINDTHGHLTGDNALRHVAGLLRQCVRADDVVARLGGDEFFVLLPGISWDRALNIVDRLAALVQEMPLPIEGTGTVPLRLSVGVAVYPDDALQPHALFACADARLYEAKRSGGRSARDGRGVPRDDTDLDGFDMLSALVATVDNKDRYTREHSEHVAAYACALADALGLSLEIQRKLRVAGLLHDVGKIGVPDRILRKPGPLNADEWEAMKQHVLLSTTLLRTLGIDADVLAAVAHHHERWDGMGYPAGLQGTEVPLLGRIMILADAVSAMVVDRPYRAGLPLDTVLHELRTQAGRQFDPALVDPFLSVFPRLFAGMRGEVA